MTTDTPQPVAEEQPPLEWEEVSKSIQFLLAGCPVAKHVWLGPAQCDALWRYIHKCAKEGPLPPEWARATKLGSLQGLTIGDLILIEASVNGVSISGIKDSERLKDDPKPAALDQIKQHIQTAISNGDASLADRWLDLLAKAKQLDL